ncbi:ROK family protein [Parashewanella spongiae]|uniref:N-acetylglucosamine kinase n=1 Tax=Parashewanella spongiae TaxID=342950 RepID=A0A3A6U310_9GAMM|nr:ROK family protein [Parashewanella spongiae]MCL1077949.1 ROK family protein [Parashewanella spongiae]RJY18431.1 ROK family protein [Parashewanella spongiae]
MICGIDIGGTKIEIAAFDSSYNQYIQRRVSTPTSDYSEFLSLIKTLVDEIDKTFSYKSHVGIGFPGIIDVNGRHLSANIPCITGKTLTADLKKLLDRNVTSENDCVCFALAETIDGAGRGFQRVFSAILGTGAAGALFVDGNIAMGKNRISGEYGHIPLPAFLQRKYSLPHQSCGCGLNDCMEQYVAGPGLERLYQHMSPDNSSIDTYNVIAQYRQGDPIAIQVFQCYLELLGYTFSSIVMHHDPDIIVLGGGMSQVTEIVKSLPQAMQPFLFTNVNPPIVVSALFEKSAGSRGAAMLTQIPLTRSQ